MTGFVDSSVLVRAYLRDEPGHEQAVTAVFATDRAIVVSELALLECVASFQHAVRTRRFSAEVADRLCEVFDADTSGAGRIAVLRSDMGRIVNRARVIVRAERVRSLDALHLAVADLDGRRVAGTDDFVFVTADHVQAEAARSLGMETQLVG